MSYGPAQSPAVVLQFDGRWWRFTGLEHFFVTKIPAEVEPLLVEIETQVERNGLFAAGYIAYETAAAYGLTVHPSTPTGLPLLWFGLFQQREEIAPPQRTAEYSVGHWHPSLDYTAYREAVARIKAAIASGYTYQANFTFQLQADFSGDEWSLFAAMSEAQRADYGAFLDLGRFVVCSASPELFFRLDGDRLISRPMKGTALRGLTVADDNAQKSYLHTSEKNRAENVMIVDMIRNDFGRIAATGTVKVPELFTIETYPTLLQMTSTVTARTSASLAEILAATFPCASITGAPKVSTMAILRDLETGPRGIYTGAIGLIAPGRQVQFNVAIRTAVVDRQSGQVSYGVGSGIVWDSEPESEFEECLLKSRLLSREAQELADFCLLESILWHPEQGYVLLDAHLERLAESAAYFGFSVNIAEARGRLEQTKPKLQTASKVRLLVDRRGHIRLESRPLADDALPVPIQIGLAREPVSSGDVRLYHKTTRREVYDQARKSRPDCDEVLLWNERGELTEGTTANVVLEIDGQRFTPPVSSGLLNGTYRAHLLATGQISERIISIEELPSATGVWLINSVRLWQEAFLVKAGQRVD